MIVALFFTVGSSIIRCLFVLVLVVHGNSLHSGLEICCVHVVRSSICVTPWSTTSTIASTSSALAALAVVVDGDDSGDSGGGCGGGRRFQR